MEYAGIFMLPLFLFLIGMAIIRFRRLSPSKDVGLLPPAWQHLLLWGVAFTFLVATIELGSGGGEWGAWKSKYSSADIAVRIVAVGLLYPIAEEFFFRGVFLGVVRRRFGDVAGVLGPAILFALVHVQYDWRAMFFIFMDGLIFGICRVRTGSVYVPMLLHIIGNSFAVWQRLY